MALSDKLSDPTLQANLVKDCVKLMDEQVAAKGGIGGLAIKAAYGVVKNIEPSYISAALNRLMPEALSALDPMWEEGMQAGDPVQHLTQNSSRTADTLLSITDARIEKSNNGVMRSTYGKFRKSVKNDIEEAVPDLAKILGTHAMG